MNSIHLSCTNKNTVCAHIRSVSFVRSRLKYISLHNFRHIIIHASKAKKKKKHFADPRERQNEWWRISKNKKKSRVTSTHKRHYGKMLIFFSWNRTNRNWAGERTRTKKPATTSRAHKFPMKFHTNRYENDNETAKVNQPRKKTQPILLCGKNSINEAIWCLYACTFRYI